MLAVFAQTTTTVEESAPRIVGDPLPLWLWWAAGIAVLVVILAAGWYVNRRQRDAGR